MPTSAYNLTPNTLKGRLPEAVGDVIFVNATGGTANGDGTSQRPFSTLDAAISKSGVSAGDVIVMMPGHAETIASAAACNLDVAGVTILGLGEGAQRPTFTFSATTSTITVTAASTTMKNFVVKPSIDSVVSPIVVSAADCNLDFEVQDASSTVECVRGLLTTAAADRLNVNLKYIGIPAGDACVNAVRLVGGNDIRLNVDFYGKASTAVVEFHTTQCTNVHVTGRFYVSGTTTLAKNVVDTVSTSTWTVEGFDAAAGYAFSGGNASAVAGADVSALSAQITTIDTKVDGIVTETSGTAGIATWKTGAAAANDVSMSEALRYAQENIILGAGTVLPADTSLFGILAGASGVTTFPNAAAPANGVSLAEVLREQYDQAEKVVVKAAATLVNGTTLFTIANGPIEILELYALCVTTCNATASTLQFNSAPTVGSAKAISGASASLASLNAGGSVILNPASLATAPDVVAHTDGGVQLGADKANRIIVNAGTITSIVGTGSTTGTFSIHMRYRPLARGVTVV